ncbi:MAG: DUF1848 domain-containing protein [Lachnospiraceae bacterium]|nr:DUF1848 domain-containing protein [Lachnospiraceae bacterium]
MILSVSRRTDIPCFYSEWFFNRLKEGFLYVRNPMNPHQISRIELSPKLIDCIVFWTKNPEPMIERIDELKEYPFYFQFTLTGYGRDIEPCVPHKKEKMLPVFQRLSQKIGAERIIWRYDPILFTPKYTPGYHVKAFQQIAGDLNGYTKRCVVSFVDTYAKIQKNLNAVQLQTPTEEEQKHFAGALSKIAQENDITVTACAEALDLKACGILPSCCIDKQLIEQLIGCRMNVGKDKNQRKECGCIESIDIGTYNTCKNGCLYCYANYSTESVIRNCQNYDINSPLLCGTVGEQDKIVQRMLKSLKNGQLSLLDN